MATQEQRDALGQVIDDVNADAKKMQTGEGLWAFLASGGNRESGDLAQQDINGAQWLMSLLGMNSQEFNTTVNDADRTIREAVNTQMTAIETGLDSAIATGNQEFIDAYKAAQSTLKEAQKKFEEEDKKGAEAAEAVYKKTMARIDEQYPAENDSVDNQEKRAEAIRLAEVQRKADLEIKDAPRIVYNDAMRDLNEKYDGKLDDPKQQEAYRAERTTIERTYREATNERLNNIQSATQALQVATAQTEVAEAKMNGQDPGRAAAEEALFKKVAVDTAAKDGPKASKQVAGGAKEYLKNVEEGKQARESKRAENLKQFVGSITDEITAVYEEKIKAARNENPLLSDDDNDRIQDLTKDRDKLLKKLGDKSNGLAGQMEYAIKQIEKNDDLGEKQKRELRSEMMQYAAKYEGDPDRFAQQFFRDKQPSMAPVDLAGIARSNGLNPSEVFSISINQKDGVKSLVIEGTGSGLDPKRRITITDPAIVDKAMKNGMSVDGLQDSLFVNVGSGLKLSEDRQLALHGTQGHDIKVWANNSGRSTYKAQDYEDLANVTRNVVSAGDGDKRFNDNREVRAYGQDLAAMERRAAEMEALAKRAEKANSRMAAAQARIEAAGLPPEVLAAVKGEKARSGIKDGPTDVSDGTTVANNGRGGKQPTREAGLS